jgi:hypothetical protein
MFLPLKANFFNRHSACGIRLIAIIAAVYPTRYIVLQPGANICRGFRKKRRFRLRIKPALSYRQSFAQICSYFTETAA